MFSTKKALARNNFLSRVQKIVGGARRAQKTQAHFSTIFPSMKSKFFREDFGCVREHGWKSGWSKRKTSGRTEKSFSIPSLKKGVLAGELKGGGRENLWCVCTMGCWADVHKNTSLPAARWYFVSQEKLTTGFGGEEYAIAMYRCLFSGALVPIVDSVTLV